MLVTLGGQMTFMASSCCKFDTHTSQWFVHATPIGKTITITTTMFFCLYAVDKVGIGMTEVEGCKDINTFCCC